MSRIRLTMSQALVRYLAAQFAHVDGQRVRLFGGVWAIFGHGNVSALGEALYHYRNELPTLRGHNEQSMALAGIAYAKAYRRARMMACTSSIGPGATNMLTAAALAHVNRLPLLLLPGDVFATRAPDPVLQQLEDFSDPTVSVNDCFRPVSRYWDRISRPEQLLTSLPRALQVLTNPAECGPVTLSLPQDVQAMAHDYPESFFHPRTHQIIRPGPDHGQLEQACQKLRESERPLLVAGGGVHYSEASQELARFASDHQVPVAETQAGKGSLTWEHPMSVGAIGVTGTRAANELASNADLVIAVGTRLQDFTTASRTLFERTDLPILSLNVTAFDAIKHGSTALTADARRGLQELSLGAGWWRSSENWSARVQGLRAQWNTLVSEAYRPDTSRLPSDAEVIGAVHRAAEDNGTVVCAAGGLPGELHALWQNRRNDDYHLEYGYSCMGYEIAGGLGVKLARPEQDVFVMVGDGSYLMMNSEIATSVMMGQKLTIIVLNNRGFGCINRLQNACGGESFNNLWKDVQDSGPRAPDIDFTAHARALGAEAVTVKTIDALDGALAEAAGADSTRVIVIETDPMTTTEVGGAWWDVAIPEVSERPQVLQAREAYLDAKRRQGGDA
jgi:3D-(3,5/4)-trihydroxycyclohexane-1,2-dione acylhydrolase (decyclizing)